MKQIVSKCFKVVLVGVAFSAIADGEPKWVEVENGAWTPSPNVIEQLRSGLKDYARKAAAEQRRKLKEWNDYTFQYQGQEQSGHKYIFVNAFCSKHASASPNREMVLVFDGGSCFFNVKYDSKKNQFFEFSINGES